MADSLRDQLLKAGFKPAPEKRKRPARRPKPPPRQAQAESEPEPVAPELPPESEHCVAEAAPERPRKKKKKKKGLGSLADKSSPAYQQAMARAAQLARERAGVDSALLAAAPGAEDLPFNFVHEGRIRCLYVKAEERDALAAGRLAIVAGAEGYALATVEEAEKLLQEAPERVVHHAAEPEGGEDPEAEHPVPDDLHW